MKRILLVMLSLGLVLAFSASAMAVDVKFSGSMYVAGMYLDKTDLRAVNTANGNTAGAYSATSTAFFYQKVQIGTDFIVSPGLKLVTKLDGMERIWGASRASATATTGLTPSNVSNDNSSVNTRAENENISFEAGYIEYLSPIGMIRAGYQPRGSWGTIWGNDAINGSAEPGLSYGIAFGPVTAGLGYVKKSEQSRNSYATSSQNAVDRDYDQYSIFGIYKANKDIEGGLAVTYRRIATTRGAVTDPGYLLVAQSPTMAHAYIFTPYVKAAFGPVSLEGEFQYAWGEANWENGVVANAVKISQMGGYLGAKVDVGMVYGGMKFVYIGGDDVGTTDTMEGGFVAGGKDFSPGLIMFNYERSYWAGSMAGYGYNTSTGNTARYGSYTGSTTIDNNSSVEWGNVLLVKGDVGVRPVKDLDINMAVIWAAADKKPPTVVSSAYGWEVDLTGTYKITNNLSYMLGAGYLFTGDFFKGPSLNESTNKIQDNYLLVNKLTLTF